MAELSVYIAELSAQMPALSPTGRKRSIGCQGSTGSSPRTHTLPRSPPEVTDINQKSGIRGSGAHPTKNLKIKIILIVFYLH